MGNPRKCKGICHPLQVGYLTGYKATSQRGNYRYAHHYFDVDPADVTEKLFGEMQDTRYLDILHVGDFYTQANTYNTAGLRLLASEAAAVTWYADNYDFPRPATTGEDAVKDFLAMGKTVVFYTGRAGEIIIAKSPDYGHPAVGVTEIAATNTFLANIGSSTVVRSTLDNLADSTRVFVHDGVRDDAAAIINPNNPMNNKYVPKYVSNAYLKLRAKWDQTKSTNLAVPATYSKTGHMFKSDLLGTLAISNADPDTHLMLEKTATAEFTSSTYLAAPNWTSVSHTYQLEYRAPYYRFVPGTGSVTPHEGKRQFYAEGTIELEPIVTAERINSGLLLVVTDAIRSRYVLGYGPGHDSWNAEWLRYALLEYIQSGADCKKAIYTLGFNYPSTAYTAGLPATEKTTAAGTALTTYWSLARGVGAWNGVFHDEEHLDGADPDNLVVHSYFNYTSPARYEFKVDTPTGVPQEDIPGAYVYTWFNGPIYVGKQQIHLNTAARANNNTQEYPIRSATATIAQVTAGGHIARSLTAPSGSPAGTWSAFWLWKEDEPFEDRTDMCFIVPADITYKPTGANPWVQYTEGKMYLVVFQDGKRYACSPEKNKQSAIPTDLIVETWATSTQDTSTSPGRLQYFPLDKFYEIADVGEPFDTASQPDFESTTLPYALGLMIDIPKGALEPDRSVAEGNDPVIFEFQVYDDARSLVGVLPDSTTDYDDEYGDLDLFVPTEDEEEVPP